MSEGARYRVFESLESPFADSGNLERVFGISQNGDPQEFFTSEGEFFLFFPGSKVDFLDGKRELLDGDIFAGSNFISEMQNQAAHVTLDNVGFNPQGFIPTVGQLQVGQVYIVYPSSSVFIQRDRPRGRTKIYAYDHPVEVYFRGVLRPFVIPPRMYVTISDTNITPKTSQLYYSKLKKEFLLRRYDIVYPPDPISDKPADRIPLAMEYQNVWHKKMESFARTLPETWVTFPPSSFMGKMVAFVTRMQADFAFGYPEQRKHMVDFLGMVHPFLDAHFSLKNQKTQEAQAHLAEFDRVYGSPEWMRLLQENPDMAEQWETLVRSHRSWLQTTFADDPERVFFDFWFGRDTERDIDILEHRFTMVENMIANNLLEGAEGAIKGLKDVLDSFETNPQERYRVTRLRRLMGELIRGEPVFHEPEIVKLYSSILQKEMVIYLDPKEREEITLEAAQDVLYLLRKFLMDNPNKEIGRALGNIYEYLDIEAIARKQGRQIFTEDELATIDLVELVGNTGLSSDDIKRIREDMDRNREVSERLRSILPDPKEEETPVVENTFIFTENDLRSFLQEVDINVERIEIELQEERERMLFSGATFKGEPVSGVFLIVVQGFESFQVKNERFTGVNRNNVERILKRVEQQITRENTPEEEEDTSFIPWQNTTEAIYERTYVQQLLIQKGLRVSRDSVKALDTQWENFIVEEAVFNNQNTIEFNFNSKTEEVTNLVIFFGRESLNLGAEVIPLNDLMRVLQEKIDERNAAVFKSRNPLGR